MQPSPEKTARPWSWTRHLPWAVLVVAAAAPWFGRAAPVSLVSFTNGTVANAPDVNANFSALSSAIAAQARWTPIDPVNLGALPNAAVPIIYDLPAQVPASAVEVLVYARAYTGSTSPEGGREFRLSTVDEVDSNKLYSKYLFVYAYGQSAVPYSSATFWLPVTTGRKLHVARISGSAITGSFGSGVFITGYR